MRARTPALHGLIPALELRCPQRRQAREQQRHRLAPRTRELTHRAIAQDRAAKAIGNDQSAFFRNDLTRKILGHAEEKAIATPDGADLRFYFMEMNTRLQVEHRCQIVGFGPNGTVYLAAREGREVFVEKTRLVN